MAKKSAGILFFRFVDILPEVLLVHPGGPFWAKRDLGVWSIPKGEFEDEEEPLAAAVREVKEELGIEVSGEFIQLSAVKQKSGKIIYAWAMQKDIDVSKIICNTFELEWPPRSGIKQSFSEVDRAGWFSVNEAVEKILPYQKPLLAELITRFQAGSIYA